MMSADSSRVKRKRISNVARQDQKEPSDSLKRIKSDESSQIQSRPWWQTGLIYHIYPRSFYDSNADGIGDLKGITSKADHFDEIGVEVIWISPIFESPMLDFGYDVSNFTAIDPIFGTIEDFDNLLLAYHLRGIKVVLDFVPNHSSDQHEWFQKSLQNDPKYSDYYVWKDPLGYDDDNNPIPPNNWLSNFRYSAWEWSDERQQFYYHAFLKEQPDLNYRNPDLVEDMHNAMRYWLDRGVDGLRIDAIIYLLEVEDVYGNNEPVAVDSGITDPTQYAYLNHTLTIDQPETYENVRGFRLVMDEYPNKKLMLVEAYTSIEKTMEYYGNTTSPLADFPFNFLLISYFPNRTELTGTNMKKAVDTWLTNMPPGKWPNWVLGNHDNSRVASRFGSDLVDALHMFTLLLPGTAVTYYGEEIGMVNTFIPYNDTQDPNGCAQGPDHYQETSRDPERTPMQWDDTKFSGFTEGNETWIPVNENYLQLNVKAQKETEQSHIKVYGELARLRKQLAFLDGELVFQIADDNTLAFVRQATEQGDPSYVVVINTSTDQNTVDTTVGSYPVPDTGTILIRSSGDNRPETAPGTLASMKSITLLSGQGLVIQI